MEFDIGQDQINTYGDPDLSHDCTFAGTDKAFDLQILLDPFKEPFDLPARFVNIGNRCIL